MSEQWIVIFPSMFVFDGTLRWVSYFLLLYDFPDFTNSDTVTHSRSVTNLMLSNRVYSILLVSILLYFFTVVNV